MNKTLTYSTQNLRMIYDNLSNLKKQGRAKDFQIRIDDFICVERTSNLSKFYWFQKSLSNYSNEISIYIFNGKSRCYDKYLLIRNGNRSPDPNMTPEEYIKTEVEKGLKLQKQEWEFKEMKEKVESQKKKIVSLKDQVKELKSKSSGDIKSILQAIQGMVGNKANVESPPDLNGIPNEKLIEMIGHYRNKLGDEVFGKALGIMLKAANNPELLDDIEEFINEKLKENESKKK